MGGRKTVARDPPTTTSGFHYDEQMSGGEMGRKEKQSSSVCHGESRNWRDEGGEEHMWCLSLC